MVNNGIWEALQTTSDRAPVMPREKFYGVAQGRTPGVYRTWGDAKRQVTCPQHDTRALEP